MRKLLFAMLACTITLAFEEALEEAQDQIEEGADEVKKALDEAGDEIEKAKEKLE